MLRPAFIALLLITTLAALACPDGLPPVSHARENVADVLIAHVRQHYRSIDTEGDLLYVSIADQRLYHLRGGRLVADYPVSTAANGPGCRHGSHRTPTGLHRINGKFGDGLPPYAVLRDRVFTGRFANPLFADATQDVITSRVLWLDGLEPGRNRGSRVDSHTRRIYIHGTANEQDIGRPASRGCVRMLNRDVIELFDRVPDHTPVVILEH